MRVAAALAGLLARRGRRPAPRDRRGTRRRGVPRRSSAGSSRTRRARRRRRGRPRARVARARRASPPTRSARRTRPATACSPSRRVPQGALPGRVRVGDPQPPRRHVRDVGARRGPAPPRRRVPRAVRRSARRGRRDARADGRRARRARRACSGCARGDRRRAIVAARARAAVRHPRRLRRPRAPDAARARVADPAPARSTGPGARALAAARGARPARACASRVGARRAHDAHAGARLARRRRRAARPTPRRRRSRCPSCRSSTSRERVRGELQATGLWFSGASARRRSIRRRRWRGARPGGRARAPRRAPRRGRRDCRARSARVETKQGERMLFLTLADRSGARRVRAVPGRLPALRAPSRAAQVVRVEGRVDDTLGAITRRRRARVGVRRRRTQHGGRPLAPPCGTRGPMSVLSLTSGSLRREIYATHRESPRALNTAHLTQWARPSAALDGQRRPTRESRRRSRPLSRRMLSARDSLDQAPALFPAAVASRSISRLAFPTWTSRSQDTPVALPRDVREGTRGRGGEDDHSPSSPRIAHRLERERDVLVEVDAQLGGAVRRCRRGSRCGRSRRASSSSSPRRPRPASSDFSGVTSAHATRKPHSSSQANSARAIARVARHAAVGGVAEHGAADVLGPAERAQDLDALHRDGARRRDGAPSRSRGSGR